MSSQHQLFANTQSSAGLTMKISVVTNTWTEPAVTVKCMIKMGKIISSLLNKIVKLSKTYQGNPFST